MAGNRLTISGRRIPIQFNRLTRMVRHAHRQWVCFLTRLPNPPTHTMTMQTSPNLSAQTNPLVNSGLLPPRTIPTPQPPQSIPPHANTLAFTKPNTLLPNSQVGIAETGQSPRCMFYLHFSLFLPGSGKTAAFVIYAFFHLQPPHIHGFR
jgi:hypothetical protein